jgi:hypothetical protein
MFLPNLIDDNPISVQVPEWWATLTFDVCLPPSPPAPGERPADGWGGHNRNVLDWITLLRHRLYLQVIRGKEVACRVVQSGEGDLIANLGLQQNKFGIGKPGL